MNRRTRTLRALGIGLIAASVAGFALARTASAEREPATSLHASVAARTQLGPGVAALRNPAALRFDVNRGQFDSEVQYAARGRGYGLYLTHDGATLSLARSRSLATSAAKSALPPEQSAESTISMRVVGARNVTAHGLTALPGASNYFLGSDSAHWRAGVEGFASVEYPQILPGISLVYYGTAGRELEYDFVLDPGADPQLIELEFGGIDHIEIAADGSALLELPNGDRLHKAPPVTYQTNERGERVAVVSRYEMRAGNRLGFSVGSYDRTRGLSIDPVLLYSTYMGSTAYDEAFGVASDASGNSYIAGYTASNLFTLVSPFQAASGGGGSDAFVAKFDSSGALVYSTYLGGSGADVAYAIAADVAGNAYVTGVTFSTNFPTASPLQAAAGGKEDAFVTKLNAQGSALSYSTYLGGSQDDYAQGIAVGSSGSAYLVGVTFSANFPRAQALQATLSGTSDAFVTALTSAGTAFTYSTFLGGSAGDNAHAVAVDSSGNAYVAGSTGSSNFPLAAPLQAVFAGGDLDGFVSKLNSQGSSLLYSTYLGGNFSDEVLSIAVHSSSGTASVTGYTTSTNFPTRSALQANLASAGHSDAFVSRFNTTGSALSYSSYLGGSGEDRGTGIGVDATNATYVVGSTDSSDFQTQKAIPGMASYQGAVDAFATAYDSFGALVYSSYLGGSAEDRAVGVSVQSANGITHIVGNTSSSNFPTQGAPIGHALGSQDAFLARLPGAAAVAVPGSSRWDVLFLSGLLLGAGLWCASLQRKANRVLA